MGINRGESLRQTFRGYRTGLSSLFLFTLPSSPHLSAIQPSAAIKCNAARCSFLPLVNLFTMGWLSLRSRLTGPTSFDPVPTPVTGFKPFTEYVEHIVSETPPPSEYPIQDPSVPDDALPFIPPALVRNQRSRFSQAKGRAWIVVDNIVYDCSDFINVHPGGDTVIRSFVGEDCSWQFWRFHSKSIMGRWGRPMRVGRTEGIENRFKEPPRYFGSSKVRQA